MMGLTVTNILASLKYIDESFPVGKTIDSGLAVKDLFFNNLNITTDPIFNFGIGTNHDLSDSLFLRLETIYHFIYEKYQEGATENGNLFSLSLGIGYKF